jgi:hypothetical protein
MQTNAPKMYDEIFGDPLPKEALFAPKMPLYLIRQFGQNSSLCDGEQIERVLSLRANYANATR